MEVVHKSAFEAYQNAAKKNDPVAQYCDDLCYSHGTGVETDFKKAIGLYEQAPPKHRLAHAQQIHSLALRYGNGVDVDRDDKKAVELYKQAAEQGYIPAQYALGSCYNKGTGIEKDTHNAFGLYHKAAEQGYAPAQYKIGKYLY